MNEYTWKEFKEAVEKAGVTDEMVMSYIDTNGTYVPQVETHGGTFNVGHGDYIYRDCKRCDHEYVCKSEINVCPRCGLRQ